MRKAFVHHIMTAVMLRVKSGEFLKYNIGSFLKDYGLNIKFIAHFIMIQISHLLLDNNIILQE